MNEGVNNMSRVNEWFSISNVSEKVNIPHETVRRYVRHYRDYLKLKRGERNAYLVHESSLGIIKRIRYLLEQGHQREQVKNILENTAEIIVKTSDEETNEQIISQPQLHEMLIKEIQKIAKQNEELLESLNSMHERMNGYEELFMQLQAAASEQIYEQDKEQRDNERKRDAYLMRAMNESQEKRKGIASTKEKKRIFTKLFKK